MSQRRMFSLKVIDTDEFLDMPQTTQLLYYNLAMRADDDGFVGNPKKIMRISGCGNDDMKVLITKKFVIPFESGICVIRHWRIHNYIQSDRYCETEYLEEKKTLLLNNGKYEKREECIQDVSKLDTQGRLGKDKIEGGDKPPTPQSPSPIKEIEAYFTSRVKEELGFEPEINFKKVGGLLKNLSKRYSKDQLKRLVDYYLCSKKCLDLGVDLAICLSSNTINLWLQDEGAEE